MLLSLERLDDDDAHLERAQSLRDSSRAHQLLAKTCVRDGKPEAAEPHLKR